MHLFPSHQYVSILLRNDEDSQLKRWDNFSYPRKVIFRFSSSETTYWNHFQKWNFVFLVNLESVLVLVSPQYASGRSTQASILKATTLILNYGAVDWCCYRADLYVMFSIDTTYVYSMLSVRSAKKRWYLRAFDMILIFQMDICWSLFSTCVCLCV